MALVYMRGTSQHQPIEQACLVEFPAAVALVNEASDCMCEVLKHMYLTVIFCTG